MILTDYTIQQRYIKNMKIRHDFINKAFNYLNNLDKIGVNVVIYISFLK